MSRPVLCYSTEADIYMLLSTVLFFVIVSGHFQALQSSFSASLSGHISEMVLTMMLGELDARSLLVGCVLALLSLLWWRSTRRPAGAPPGPGFALPLLGHLHRLNRDPRAQFQQWRRQYGDVFSLYMGSRLVVVFNGYSVLKEAFVKFADVFSERPHMFMTDRISEGRGIILSSGQSWKEQRKTSLEILREFGMGKNVLAEKIQEEVSHYIGAIEEHQGQPADLHRMTTISVSNNICSIVFGKRFQYDDPVFTSYLEILEDNIKRLGGSAVINFVPFLEHLPGDLFSIKKVLSNVKRINSTFFQPLIHTHINTFSGTDNEATDFIYAYLREMRKKEGQGVSTSLCEKELETTVGDLFIAGTETSSTAILWALLYFLHHPHVQDRCYQEICDIIGTSRPPTIRDRAKMVYLEATINEVLRVADIAPFAVLHSTPCDVTFRGYVIPEDVIIFPVMDSVLRDPEIWGDPENFRPERFLDAEGKLVRPEEFIPFSLGRRVCLGEALARMELFLYLCTLIQRFRFLPPEPEKPPPIVGYLGGTHAPVPYKIRAVSRE